MSKIPAIVIFNIFFGLDEAMVVVYLRQLMEGGKTDFFQSLAALGQHSVLFNAGIVTFLTSQSFAGWPNYGFEQFREAGTIIMLLTLGFIAGRNPKERIAYFFLSFGIWDIFYYFWLFVLIGWPKSVWDPDILFLLPVPWVAPVVVPLVISISFVGIPLYYLLKN